MRQLTADMMASAQDAVNLPGYSTSDTAGLQIGRVADMLQQKHKAQHKAAITSSFPSLEAFLQDAKVQAAECLPKMQALGLQLFQMPTLTVSELMEQCGASWAAAKRIEARASRYSDE